MSDFTPTSYSTIAAALSAILAGYATLAIDTNRVSDGADSYGLFKAPTRTTKEYNDGSYAITEYYSFYARQAAVSEEDRADSDVWLEGLAYWADDYAYKSTPFPELTGNRTIHSIELTGAPYPMESGSEDMLYQMSVSITYIREREV